MQVPGGRLVAAVVILACAGCSTTAGPGEPDPHDYVVVFELQPDAGGRLQRLAVSGVLDERTGRPVVYLPSAVFVNQARDALVERPWNVTYDETGKIKPVHVRCLLSAAKPDVPDCSAPE
jgi:hypothetical protein